MSEDLKLEILPNGYLRFKRGSKKHNKKMMEVLEFLTEQDEMTFEELEEFFKGSEDVKLIHGDTTLCG